MGVSLRPKHLKECMKLTAVIGISKGVERGRRSRTKSLLQGRHGYFLELYKLSVQSLAYKQSLFSSKICGKNVGNK